MILFFLKFAPFFYTSFIMTSFTSPTTYPLLLMQDCYSIHSLCYFSQPRPFSCPPPTFPFKRYGQLLLKEAEIKNDARVNLPHKSVVPDILLMYSALSRCDTICYQYIILGSNVPVDWMRSVEIIL